MTNISEIIDRLSEASGPDRELDRDIMLAVRHGKDWMLTTPESAKVWALHFTSSTDAALSLVPEGMVWRLDWNGRNSSCTRYDNDDGRYQERRSLAATPSLALCIAALSARNSGDEE